MIPADIAKEIRELRYNTRKAAADYHTQPGPTLTPTDEEKRTAVRAVLAGRISRREVARVLNVPATTVNGWVDAERKRRGAK